MKRFQPHDSDGLQAPWNLPMSRSIERESQSDFTLKANGNRPALAGLFQREKDVTRKGYISSQLAGDSRSRDLPPGTGSAVAARSILMKTLGHTPNRFVTKLSNFCKRVHG